MCSLALVLRRLIAAQALAICIAAPAAAVTIWWTGGHPDDDRYGNPHNWAYTNHAHGVPLISDDVYITESEHRDPDLQNLPAAVIDDTMSGANAVQSGPVYIGGWGDGLVAHHGEKRGAGVLDITGGEWIFPDCNYLRLGFDGGFGTINQTGGAVSTCTQLSIAFGASDSLGVWNLEAGSVEAAGIDIGVQGTGVFNMQGGTFTGTNNSHIGRGFGWHHTYHPAAGLFEHRGGVFSQTSVTIGSNDGSSGIVTVRNGADLRVGKTLSIGLFGYGHVIQTGGILDVGSRIDLGIFEGSVGTLTLDGGLLLGHNLNVGRKGIGQMMVIGSESTIDFDKNYQQSGRSLLSFRLDDSADHISPIQVARKASFESGAQIRMLHAAGYTPRSDQEFTLVAAGYVVDRGLRLVGEYADDYELLVSRRAVVARWIGAAD